MGAADTADGPGHDRAVTSLRDAFDVAVAAGDDRRGRRLARELAETEGGDAAIERIARSAADGSTLAVELLVEAIDERGLARRFVGSLLLDKTAIDEVTQDTLIAVATSIASFRGASKFTTWLHRVARNHSIDYLRRQRPTVQLEEQDQGEAFHISSMIATRATVRDALAQLPEMYRDAVTLRDVDGHPYDEVARQLGRNINTVKAHVARGRALVAARMGEDER